MAEDEKQELEENPLPIESSTETETESEQISNDEQENTSQKTNSSTSFENITADELLPESGDPIEDSFQAKLKNLSMKSRSQIKKRKITLTKVVIVLIVIIGSVLVMLELNKDPNAKGKLLLYELPEMTVNVFSEVDNLPRNITVNVSIGVDENDIKMLNTDECYNIVYKALSSMTFEEYNTVNAQYNIKETVHDAFIENSAESMNVKVYVSGLDLGKFNMEGLTAPTQEDINAAKSKNLGDKLNDNLN